jgi:hypothetical protein
VLLLLLLPWVEACWELLIPLLLRLVAVQVLWRVGFS